MAAARKGQVREAQALYAAGAVEELGNASEVAVPVVQMDAAFVGCGQREIPAPATEQGLVGNIDDTLSRPQVPVKYRCAAVDSRPDMG